jgi:hypothetical protein
LSSKSRRRAVAVIPGKKHRVWIIPLVCGIVGNEIVSPKDEARRLNSRRNLRPDACAGEIQAAKKAKPKAYHSMHLQMHG